MLLVCRVSLIIRSLLCALAHSLHLKLDFRLIVLIWEANRRITLYLFLKLMATFSLWMVIYSLCIFSKYSVKPCNCSGGTWLLYIGSVLGGAKLKSSGITSSMFISLKSYNAINRNHKITSKSCTQFCPQLSSTEPCKISKKLCDDDLWHKDYLVKIRFSLLLITNLVVLTVNVTVIKINWRWHVLVKYLCSEVSRDWTTRNWLPLIRRTMAFMPWTSCQWWPHRTLGWECWSWGWWVHIWIFFCWLSSNHILYFCMLWISASLCGCKIIIGRKRSTMNLTFLTVIPGNVVFHIRNQCATVLWGHSYTIFVLDFESRNHRSKVSVQYFCILLNV